MDVDVDRVSVVRLYDVVRQIRPLYRHLVRAVDNTLADSDVSVALRSVLEQLHDGGPHTVPQLARALLLPRQFVQKLVHDALDSGLVSLTTNPAHRRSSIVVLTPAGAASFGEIKRRELAVLDAAAQILAVDDVDACIRVLDRLRLYFANLSSTHQAGRAGTRDVSSL